MKEMLKGTNDGSCCDFRAKMDNLASKMILLDDLKPFISWILCF